MGKVFGVSKGQSSISEPLIPAGLEKSVSIVQSQKTAQDCLKVPLQWVFQINLGEMSTWIP